MNETQEKPEGLSRRLVKEIRMRGYVGFDDVLILARQNGHNYREETITRKLRADKHLTSEELKRDLAYIEPVMVEGKNVIRGYKWKESQPQLLLIK